MRDQIITRIERCCAMSHCANVNEAEAAVQRAIHLMRQHGVSRADLSPAGRASLDLLAAMFGLTGTGARAAVAHAGRAGKAARLSRVRRWRRKS